MTHMSDIHVQPKRAGNMLGLLALLVPIAFLIVGAAMHLGFVSVLGVLFGIILAIGGITRRGESKASSIVALCLWGVALLPTILLASA